MTNFTSQSALIQSGVAMLFGRRATLTFVQNIGSRLQIQIY